jgi:hypothetical protein
MIEHQVTGIADNEKQESGTEKKAIGVDPPSA